MKRRIARVIRDPGRVTGRYLEAEGLLQLDVMLRLQVRTVQHGLPDTCRAGSKASTLARHTLLRVGCGQAAAQALQCLGDLFSLAGVLVVQEACVGRLHRRQTRDGLHQK